MYCELCKNVQVKDGICAKCDAQVVKGPLAPAYQRWVEAGERWRRCCGSLNYYFGRDAAPDARAHGHLAFHGKYFEGSHEGLWVEYGASFHTDHARTYYLRDFDHYCDSEEYGADIAYDDPEFWEKLDKQLDEAPKAAFNAGLMSCEGCGYHYFDGVCCVQCEKCEEWSHATRGCGCGGVEHEQDEA